MKFKLLFTLLFTCVLAFAQQIPEDVKPPSWKQANLSDLVPFKLPSFDLKKLQDEDKINDKDKSIPWRFGHDIYVDHNFHDVGEWTTLENGDRIWRMAYTSKGAYSINFLFDVFSIPEGAKLYVYNKDKTDLLRPFTHYNNNPEEVLGTWLVQGSHAYIEYYQPANVVGEAKLTVGSVVHGYRSTATYEKSLGDSGNCNQDVDCDITPPGSDPFELNTRKEEIKAASAMIVVGGSGACSGTLVNNTNNDGKAYFMTANHCRGGEGSWAFRFNWRSPNTSCSTTTPSTNGSFNQTVSGSVLRANSAESDMELVEITDTSFFTNNTDLVWAGWNRSTVDVPVVNFGIHHPSGDIQKVCREDDGAYRANVNFEIPNTKMWYIDQWELGVTEPGSSGSGLFNETGHLIGMLSGGGAACNGTSNNGAPDYYGRFDVAWDFGSSTSTRLKEWLDPSDSGIEILDQYPALETFDNDARANAGSNSTEFCGEDFSPEVTLLNPGNLQLTSADISYFLDSDVPTAIAWTGSVPSGGSTVVATPTYSNLSPGAHTFTINVANPNGTTDENTANDSFVLNFDVAPTYLTSEVVFNITTDNYGEETSWELRNSSGSLVSSGPLFNYNDNTVYQENISIPNFNGCYTFTIFDDADDGICCAFGTGSYNLEDGNGNVIISGGDFGTSESILFNPQDPLSVDDFNLENFVKIYPNPVENKLSIELTNFNEDVDYQIYNTLGQEITKGNLNSNSIQNINMSQYESGIYFIKLSIGTNSMTQKLIKK
ncbi:T9SS type A sorting domain-containing protein [Winogradskyella forsetii]|uniref:T9SS type A sorting domain-containing protein n=1 Tax=Winogradskyella forsetii TaxID=2686077 RepID=UPI0015C1159D|nr:T9SS type A sorting domain-containing protein [Winogradskyella forsetii]